MKNIDENLTAKPIDETLIPRLKRAKLKQKASREKYQKMEHKPMLAGFNRASI